MIEIIGAMLFWVVWGAMENRVWKEQGEAWILGHFKTYHLMIGALDVATAAIGAENNTFQFLFLLFWSPLALDVTWWVIRYFDFKRDPNAAQKFYGESNPWHQQSDWDNWLGLPLVFGCYWWWWLFGGVTFVLGATILNPQWFLLSTFSAIVFIGLILLCEWLNRWNLKNGYGEWNTE